MKLLPPGEIVGRAEVQMSFVLGRFLLLTQGAYNGQRISNLTPQSEQQQKHHVRRFRIFVFGCWLPLYGLAPNFGGVRSKLI